MPYIGKQLVRGQNRKLDDISSGFNGSQTTFTLQIASQNVSVGSALQLWISVGGVIQNPLTDFTIAGNQITFTTAPAASLDFFGVIQGDVTDTNTPGDATVTTSKLATGLTVNLADGSAATSSLQLGGTDSGLFSSAADKVNVTTGGVERLEIGSSEVVFNDGSNDVDFRVESNGNAHMLFVDGGNDAVGIGTSSATSLGSGFTEVMISGNTEGAGLQLQDTDGNVKAGIFTSDNSNTATLRTITNHPLTFRTNNTERARLDTSGRLLVGTTSSTKNIQDNDKQAIVLQGNANNGGLSVTTYNGTSFSDSTGPRLNFQRSRGTTDGTMTVVTPGDLLGEVEFRGADGTNFISAATINAFSDGTPGSNDMPGRLVFSTSSDGASSPTERMRINAGGNVGIGTTECDVALHVAATAGGDVATVAEFENLGTGNNSAVRLLLRSQAGSTNTDAYIQNTGSSGGNSNLLFATEGSGSLSERMRIDSGGRLLVGTSSAINSTSYGKIQTADPTGAEIYLGRNDTTVVAGDAVGAIRFYSNDNNGVYQENASIIAAADGTQAVNNKPGRLIFSTTADDASSSTERMRITSGGNVGIGDTSPGGRLDIGFNSSSVVGLVLSNAGTGTSARFYSGSSIVGSITVSGSATAFNTSSDYRLKENVVDIADGITRVKQLSPKRFNFIINADKTVDGFLAHEAQAVVPEAVTGEKDGEEMQGIDQSKLVPLLTAALQEAIAKIETLETQNASLEARLTALEAG